jgi:hypothetical protein
MADLDLCLDSTPNDEDVEKSLRRAVKSASVSYFRKLCLRVRFTAAGAHTDLNSKPFRPLVLSKRKSCFKACNAFLRTSRRLKDYSLHCISCHGARCIPSFALACSRILTNVEQQSLLLPELKRLIPSALQVNATISAYLKSTITSSLAYRLPSLASYRTIPCLAQRCHLWFSI